MANIKISPDVEMTELKSRDNRIESRDNRIESRDDRVEYMVVD